MRTLLLILASTLLAATPASASDGPSWTWSGVYIGVHGGMDRAETGATYVKGEQGGIHAGVDYQLPVSPIVLGVGADYTWSNMTGVDGAAAIYTRAGLDLGSVAMPYVMVGYAWADTLIGNLDGYVLGGGIDLHVAERVLIGAQYRYTDFDAADRHELRATLSYKF